MASKQSKKKLSKSKKKRIMTDIGRLGAEARGSGVGSRQDFVLPAKWYTEKHEYASHEIIKFISPGKTRCHSSGKVK